MREFCRGGRLTKADAKAVAPVDPVSAVAIYEFLIECKWISASD
jgi:hypothetical protein